MSTSKSWFSHINDSGRKFEKFLRKPYSLSLTHSCTVNLHKCTENIEALEWVRKKQMINYRNGFRRFAIKSLSFSKWSASASLRRKEVGSHNEILMKSHSRKTFQFRRWLMTGKKFKFLTNSSVKWLKNLKLWSFSMNKLNFRLFWDNWD